MIRLISKYSDRPSNFSDSTIFVQIDAFVQRCCDLLEVCEGLQQFAFHSRGQAMPVFGGTRAPEIKKSLLEIEDIFLKNLARLQSVDYDLLNVTASGWQDDITTFRNQMRDLEVMYVNVINSSFEGVGTVQAAVEVLDAFYLLAKREKIKIFIMKRGEHVYNLFVQELNNIKREFDHLRRKPLLPIVQGHPTFAGTALWVKGLMLRIQRQMDELNLLCYLEPCREQDSARDLYGNVHSLLEAFVLQTFGDWVAELKLMDEANLGKRLQVGLLCRPEDTTILHRSKGGQLESNFDKELLKMFQEVYYWEKIQGSGIVVPYAAHEIASQRDQLRVLREHVLRVVRDYNQIIAALQPEERRLFLQHIRNLEDRKISPGLSRFNWNSPGIKEFFVRDSCRECAKVYDYVKQFKKNNSEISQVCKQISDLHLISIEKKAVHRDDEFKLVQERCREKMMKVFKASHEKITELMLNTYHFFEHHSADIQREWKAYVEKVDKKIEEALKKCVKTSLQELCRALNGDNKTEPSPLFRISAVLDDIRMDFKPPMNQLKDLLQLVCRDMTMTLTVIPRLGEHLLAVRAERMVAEKQKHEENGDMAAANAIVIPAEDPKAKKKKSFFEEISKDDDCCIRYVKDVLRGFNNCAVKLGERMKWWNSSYQPIVSQDKDTFIRRYKKTERSLTIVGQDIQRYKEVQSDIQQEDPKVVSDFIETDFTPLKNALMYHCQQWQGKLTDLLNENARTEMTKVIEYFDTNTNILLANPMKDWEELKIRVELLDQCRKDDEDMENRISPIEAKYAKLAEFEVVPAEEELSKKAQMRPLMEKFRETLMAAEVINNKERKKMKAGLETDLSTFQQSIKDVKAAFMTNAPYKSEGVSNDSAYQVLNSFKTQLAAKRAAEEEFIPKLELFGIEPAVYKELSWVDVEMEKLETVWDIRSGWDGEWNKLKVAVFKSLNCDDMDELAMAYQTKLRKLQGKDKSVQNWEAFIHMKQSLEVFRSMMPLITNLRQESMRERHIERIIQEVGEPFDPKAEDFSLEKVTALKLVNFSDLIAVLAEDAKKEAKIENGLESIQNIWTTMKVDVVEHKSVYFKLRSTEDLYTALEEHILQLSGFKSSQFYLPFAAKVEHWESTLANISEVCEGIQAVQKAWMYLENIFVGSEDIRPHLPEESIMFDEVNAGFTEMLRRIYQDPLATKACSQPKMLETLTTYTVMLDKIQKSLNDYLEKKRMAFPRFYFLSNDDLLEILGQSKDPEQVQKHIKKCFEGVKTLELQAPSPAQQRRNWEAVGLCAPDGEKVKLVKSVILEGPVEVWLGVCEKRMIESLRRDLARCHTANINPKSMKKEKWVKEFPAQLLITSGQIAWTTDCTVALHKMEKGQKNAMRVLKRTQTKYIAKLSDMIRKPSSRVERSKLVALITIEVHARDVQDTMVAKKCEQVNNFNWTSQLRFDLREQADELGGAQPAMCYVLQTNTCSPYGYEYQGNNGRLVVTPMTDRCYMTLTTALHLKRGGAPAGPAGTGKTESVKDLGKGMAMYVIVFNCSDGLDYKSLGRMFSGLAQSGAWGCFDEFNRIDITVLSVVAVQIMTIQAALKEEKDKFMFEERMIRLVRSCAIFITMNPGYAGRTELPDNLKALFRPVSMMVPDLGMIMEIMLVSEGFKDFKVLAKKMYTLYMMMQQQMSKQDHYDFGLRNIKSVLGCAGALKRKEPDVPEQILLMRAINDMNFPKWVSQDVPLYNALLGDIFPGVTLPIPDYGKLEEAILQVIGESGCQRAQHTINKCISIYETKVTRHGNMLVGGSLGGKSVCWKTLAKAKCHLKTWGQEGAEKVRYEVINPKSISGDELYGAYDLSTMEWTDGVLSAIMRGMCQDEKPDDKWLVLDGPVDTLWIESMNTVLDDNKILTLINGDRIGLPPTVRLLFEVGDLSVASPATVSRAGMVYFDPPDLGWEPFFQSWIERFVSANRHQDIRALGDKWIAKLLRVRSHGCVEVAPIIDVNAVQSMTRLYECIQPKVDCESLGEKAMEAYEKLFVFCCVWSLGASVTADSRQVFDAGVRETENIFPPSQTVFEYAFNYEKMDYSLWEDRLTNPYKPPEGQAFHKIIVPTVDTIRNMFILNNLNAKSFHSLLVGQTGTGKTVAVQQAISGLDDTTWTSLTINMSAMTSSNKTQDIIEARIEKRIKNKFGPPGNKHMLTFVDDLNMPRKDTFGSQPPLELLRQWVDYGCWYDRKKQTLRYVMSMHLCCGMGPPGGGRAVISARLQSAMNNLCFVNPAETQVKRIYLTLANHKLTDFRTEDIKSLGEPLVLASMGVFNQISDNFLPTPEKCHYLFNLRDVSKIFQGIYLAHPKLYEEKEQMLRLWYHEVCRVFLDRLIDMSDRDKLRIVIDSVLDGVMQTKLKDIVNEDYDMIFAGIDLDNPEAEDPPYEQLADRKKVKSFMEAKVEDYNVFFKKAPMPLVMFKDAIEQCCKILRIIRQPRGNALLVGVGGSGRHCLSRLASFIADFFCFQVEITKQYKHVSFLEDLKKLYEKAGSKGQSVTFLYSDTEIIEESFLEDVGNLLSSGEVPNIYSSDELNGVCQSVEKPAKEAGIAYGPVALYEFFISRVRENLHVVFCLSPIGSSFRDYCRMYPSLVSCTTVLWFLPWPTEALMEVALKFVREGDLDEQYQEPVANVFGRSHVAVAEYSKKLFEEQQRMNYVTPTNYLELVQGYMSLLREKQKEISKSADKLRNGLNKLDDARVQVGTMSEDLEVKLDIAGKKTKECEELLQVIVQERSKADAAQVAVEADSSRIEKEAKETKIISDDATRDLEKAMPALEAAMDALEKLDKKAISEVKAYAKPPDMVMKTMCAVMTVMEKTPSWAQAKIELNDTNFLNRIKGFDKDNISNATLRKMEKYTKDPNFTPKLVQNVSSAAGALCQWVHAMKIYAEVFREVEPKRLKLRNAQESLDKKNRELEKANADLAKIQKQVQDLKDQFDSSNKEKDDLTSQAEEMKIKLERAEKLMSGLAGEKGRWEISLGGFDAQQDNLFGDCVISSAFMSYAGPFGAKFREILMSQEWMGFVKDSKLAVTPAFSFSNFLADPSIVREWNLQGLPTDDFSTENGVLTTRGRRFPLLIDPQNQGNKWVRKMEAARQLKVFDPNSKDIMRAIERAIEYGTPILLENVKEELDPSLNDVLAKNIIETSPGNYSIKVGENTLDYNLDFKLYITTKLANPHYTPEVSTKTTIVNFIVVIGGLTDQLLGVVVSKEEPALETQKNELVVQVSKGKNRLVELESEILRLLAETKGSLLDDLSLIDTLQESKVISETVTEQVNVAEQTMVKIDAARENYRAAGARSAVLFFVLNDLVTIDPMYQFALDAYTVLYLQSIERSADKKISVGSIEERIEDLNGFHALAVYRYACRALFERHKLLLSLHLCTKVMQSLGLVDHKEYMFFLFGGQVVDRSTQAANPSPDWISQASWDNIVELDAALDTFKGFQASFEQTLRDWKTWYGSAAPEAEQLPGDWDGRLDQMQKLIVVRCIRPDRVPTAVSAYVAARLDPKFVEPPPLDLEQIYDESTCFTPLLFVLTPGMDPTAQLKALANAKHMQMQAVSLGQGQEPKAIALIKQASEQGFWGIIANCHLCIKWLPEMEKYLYQIMDNNPHKMFRCFLSSSPTPLFPIQLLQGSIKMTCEPPKGLKPNVVRLLQNFQEEEYNRVHETQKYRKLFFSLVWFHAVLLERRKFKMLGWNVPYDFNDFDFEICENLIAMYLDENPTDIPWEAMRYLIAEANYGGRVTEHPDNRVLRAYANEFFSVNALTPKFQLSSLPTYYIPEENSLSAYRAYAKELPLQDFPEAFGEHVNAEISSLIIDTNMLCEIIIGMECGGGGGGGSGDRDAQVMKTCETLLERIPEEMDQEEVADRNSSDSSPLKVCLIQEIERYNELLKKLKANNKLLIKGIQGFVVISKEQEAVLVALYEGRVPAIWLTSYPSLKSLGSWMPDLIERINQLNFWAYEGIPKAFWLGGLTYPTSFLTGLLQASARKNMVSVDALSFDFVVQSGDESAITQLPKEGAYFKNFSLEGARWDSNAGALTDAETMQLFAPMPIVHFKPVAKKKNLTDGYYQCPLYLYPIRTGSRERPSFMIWVDLKAGAHNSDFWIKRGTALLLSLAS
jgi:dynein heavy chain